MQAPPYTVEPYSQGYSKNKAKYGHSGIDKDGDEVTPCIICGRPVKDKQAIFVEITTGAEWFDKTRHTENDSQGAFPVGPSCHRKFRNKAVA